jgi:hypothetical protein
MKHGEFDLALSDLVCMIFVGMFRVVQDDKTITGSNALSTHEVANLKLNDLLCDVDKSLSLVDQLIPRLLQNDSKVFCEQIMAKADYVRMLNQSKSRFCESVA